MTKETKEYLVELISCIIDDIAQAKDYPDGDALGFVAREAEALYKALTSIPEI